MRDLVKVTIKDIAKKVNRSITTVSRALNGYDDVGPETKALIIKTAKEMGYTPNTFAQRLQKQFTDTIGLILPTFSPRFADPYFSELLAGIGNKAAALEYDLLVSTRAPGEQEIEAYRKLIEGGRVDGFIVVRTRKQDARIDYLIEQEFPFAAFGRTETKSDYSYVEEDGYFGMQLIADHIAGLGHKKIAVIISDPVLNFTGERMNGLRDGLSRHNIFLKDELIRTGDLTQKSGYETALELLHLPERPTVIIAFNDLMALGAMSAAQELGFEVGKDVLVTGFDDIPMSEHSHPSLTTVRQPVYTIGGMVCEMLIKIIKKQIEIHQQKLLKPSLVVRQSTGEGLNLSVKN
jgi:LacI family transcriptional regulator